MRASTSRPVSSKSEQVGADRAERKAYVFLDESYPVVDAVVLKTQVPDGSRQARPGPAADIISVCCHEIVPQVTAGADKPVFRRIHPTLIQVFPDGFPQQHPDRVRTPAAWFVGREAEFNLRPLPNSMGTVVNRDRPADWKISASGPR